MLQSIGTRVWKVRRAGVVQVSNRAVLAGQLLAHVLMSGAHGGRPVTLIGYSMGARSVAPAHTAVILEEPVNCNQPFLVADSPPKSHFCGQL